MYIQILTRIFCSGTRDHSLPSLLRSAAHSFSKDMTFSSKPWWQSLPSEHPSVLIYPEHPCLPYEKQWMEGHGVFLRCLQTSILHVVSQLCVLGCLLVYTSDSCPQAILWECAQSCPACPVVLPVLLWQNFIFNSFYTLQYRGLNPGLQVC